MRIDRGVEVFPGAWGSRLEDGARLRAPAASERRLCPRNSLLGEAALDPLRTRSPVQLTPESVAPQPRALRLPTWVRRFPPSAGRVCSAVLDRRHSINRSRPVATAGGAWGRHEASLR